VESQAEQGEIKNKLFEFFIKVNQKLTDTVCVKQINTLD
jgi:hypothetical protein